MTQESREQYRRETGRRPPETGDYQGWRDEYIATGHDLARRHMEEAVRTDLVVPVAESPASRSFTELLPRRRDQSVFCVALAFAVVAFNTHGAVFETSGWAAVVLLFWVNFMLVCNLRAKDRQARSS